MKRSWMSGSDWVNAALVFFALTVVCLVSITNGSQGGAPGGNYDYGYGQPADSLAQWRAPGGEFQRQPEDEEPNPVTVQDVPVNQYHHSPPQTCNQPERGAQFGGEAEHLEASHSLSAAANLEGDGTTTQSPLPPGWVEYLDPSSGNPYYHHAEDGITTWTRPEEPYTEKMSDELPATTVASPDAASDAGLTLSGQAPSNSLFQGEGMNEQQAQLNDVASDQFTMPQSKHQNTEVPQQPSIEDHDRSHPQQSSIEDHDRSPPQQPFIEDHDVSQQVPPQALQLDAASAWGNRQPQTSPPEEPLRPQPERIPWQAGAPLANQPFVNPDVVRSSPQQSAAEDPIQPRTTVADPVDQPRGTAMQVPSTPRTNENPQNFAQVQDQPQSNRWQEQSTPSSPWGYRASTGGPEEGGTKVPASGSGSGAQQGRSQPPQQQRPQPWQYQHQYPPNDPNTSRNRQPQQQAPLWSTGQQQRAAPSMQQARGAPQQGVYGQQPGSPNFPYGTTGQGGPGDLSYGGQVGTGSESPNGNARGALGSAWQGVLGFGNRTIAAVGTAGSTVVSGAASAGQTISSTSTGLWGRARSTIEQVGRSMFESSENDKNSGGSSYSLSNHGTPPGPGQGRGSMNGQSMSPPPHYGGYPRYNLPQPRTDPPNPHSGGDRQRQNPPMQSTWGASQQQAAPPQWGQGYSDGPAPTSSQQQQPRGIAGNSWQQDPPHGNQQYRQEQRPLPQGTRPMNPPPNPGWGSGQGR